MTDGGGVGYRIARVVCAARDDMRLLLGLPPRPWIGRSVTGRGHGIRPGRSGMEPGPESGGNFVTEEQFEVVRNEAVQQASSRGKADSFVLSSATKSPLDSGLGWN